MANPEISVIVTNYNHANYIKLAVESIQNQSWSDFEIIIVDDCSTDVSRDVIEDIVAEDTDIRAFFLEENKGKWHALNAAISEARAPIITLQDADDASCKDRLKRQWQVLKDEKSYHTSHTGSQDTCARSTMVSFMPSQEQTAATTLTTSC